MKKLEMVVEKVRSTMRSVEAVRSRLGIKGGGSVAAIAATYGEDFATTMAQLGQQQQQYEDEDGSGFDGDGNGGEVLNGHVI